MKRLFAFSLFVFLSICAAACAPSEEVVTVTQRVEATATAVARTPPPIATEIPPPFPTATATSIAPITDEWLTYQNETYGYRISYPANAQVETAGVADFPLEELPEGMTADSYLQQLKETHPDDICVSITLEAGSIHILAPQEAGGKYAAPCPVSDIGDYDVENASELVSINGRNYSTNGYTVHEQDEFATFRGQFYSFELENGVQISYMAAPRYSSAFASNPSQAQEEYLASKAQILEIIASYRLYFPHFEGYLIQDEPIFAGGKTRLESWSPNGRYLAYYEYTQEQLDAVTDVPGLAEGTFVIYDTASGEKCTQYQIETRYPYEGPGMGARQVWLPDSGELFLLTTENRLWQVSIPCEADAELTSLFPETIQYIHGFTPNKHRLLLAGVSQYWLYDWQTQTAVAIPEVVPDQMNNLVWSPDGRYLAITLAGNYTGNRDSVGGSRVVDMATGQIIARHDWEPANALDGTFGGPVWLSNEQFVVTLTMDQGPFFMTITGEVTPVLPLFGLVSQENIRQISAYADPATGAYHLLLTDFMGDAPFVSPRLYHSDSDSIEMLDLDPSSNPWLTADGKLMVFGETGYRSRLVTAVGDPLTRDEALLPSCARNLENGGILFEDWQLYDVDAGCQLITAVHIPDQQPSNAYGRVSPDKSWMALVINNQTLYVVSLDFLQ